VSVQLHWATTPGALGEAEATRIVDAALEHGGRAGIDIEVVIVDDAKLTELHGRFLDDATPTDVISFDLGEEGEGPAAELYVSIDCARRVAAERGVSEDRELALYLVHGTLHLCGHDDHADDDRARMRAAERDVLRALGYEDDTSPHDRDAV
jgi:probable rRNA maturation factor